MTEVKSRNTIFIEKDFPSRGSLTYSKTLCEYEEEGVTQLTAPSGRIEPFSLDDIEENSLSVRDTLSELAKENWQKAR